MANSESEDFESADEGIMKSHGNSSRTDQKNEKALSSLKKPSLPNSFSTALESLPEALRADLARSDQKSSAITLIPANIDGADAAKTEVPQPSSDKSFRAVSTSAPLNHESLGAKPKLLQKNRTKSHSMHRAHREALVAADDAVVNINDPNQDTSQRKRRGTNKLGVKISPSSIPPSEMVSPDNNQLKGESKVSWSGTFSETNTDNQDLHDPIQPLLDKLASLDVVDSADEVVDISNDKPSSGWGAWSSWMMSGASSVSTHVTQGLSTVSSVIESGLGAVDPQEMAKITVEESKSLSDPSECVSDATSDQASSSFNVVGNVLKFVESTGEMIVASGLNTLETIGKKTMDVLQDGDPGLKKKRAMFSKEPDKPTLSQVLREARIRAETEDRERVQAKKASRAHFETLFDDYKGMIHLEALEMLSNTCHLKLEAKLLALSGTVLVEFQRKLIQIKDQCDIPDDDDEEDDEDRGSVERLERDLTIAMRGLMVPVSHTKLIRVSEDTDAWLATMRCMQDEETCNENDEWVDDTDDTDPQSALHEIHQQAIRALAKFTAAVAEHFHKTAELLLLKEEHNSTLESQCLVLMTSVLCSRVSSIAARFSELLSASANVLDSAQVDHNDVNLLITNVFLEASNSSSYIQDASLLLIPVIQLGAVQ